MKLPRVSIVIPAYNEEKDIGRLLDSLMKLNYPKKKLEIIVVDDGSIDNTSKIVSKYSVRMIKGPHKGVGVARNFGWRSAKSDIIIFIDADVVVHKNFVKEMIKYYKDPKIAGVNNREILLNKKNLIARLSYLRKILALNYVKFRILRTCKKSILKQVGGFDPDYGFYDDWELTMRIVKLGYKVIYAPKAIVWHKEPETWKELYRQSIWTGRSMLFSFKGYKKEAIRRVLFSLLCASLPVYIIFSFLSLPFQILGIVGLILFSFIEFKRSLEIFLIIKRKESFFTPFFDFISMLLVCFGMFDGLLHIKQKSIKA